LSDQLPKASFFSNLGRAKYSVHAFYVACAALFGLQAFSLIFVVGRSDNGDQEQKKDNRYDQKLYRHPVHLQYASSIIPNPDRKENVQSLNNLLQTALSHLGSTCHNPLVFFFF